MAQFKIIAIAVGTLLYEVNERTGNYVNGNDNKGIYDFLTLDNVIIQKIKLTDNDLTFKRGDRIIVSTNSDNNVTSTLVIARFKMIANKVYFIGENSNTWYPLDRYRIYVPTPTVTVIPSTPKTVASGSIPNTPELQVIEDQIVKSDYISKLKLERYNHDASLSLEQFLVNFLRNTNIAFNTIYSTGTREGQIQTTHGRRRSIGDIFKICRAYYPECTLADVANILYQKHTSTGSLNFVGSLICSQINKRVWWNNATHRFSSPERNDEYGLTQEGWLNLIKKALIIKPTATKMPLVDIEVDDYIICNATNTGLKITKDFQYPVISLGKDAQAGTIEITNDAGVTARVSNEFFSPSLLKQAKIKFPKGCKIKTVGGSSLTIDSVKFENTGRNIIQISPSGSRRIVYSVESKQWAKKI